MTSCLATLAGSIGLVFATLVEAQPPPESKPPAKPAANAPVQEVGGRLVVSGETVVVTANPDQPARESSVATKTDTLLLETPRSITVVDRQTLDDLGAINITQAHDYAVGFIPLDERGPGFARGFPVGFYDLRRDGLRTFTWSVREPAALERVQYLRGSASILYGDGSPGGLVNMVLKKPLPVPRFEIAASGGGLGFGRVSADATGPLTDDRTIRYRVVGAAEWLDNGIDNDERRLTLMPMLAFDLNAGTTISFDTEIYDQRGRNYRHAVPATPEAQRGDFSGFPWNLSAASPDDGWTGGNVAPGVRLDVALGEQSSLHVAARYTKIEGDLDFHAIVGLAPDGRTAIRAHYREISDWQEFQSDSFVTFAARTGRIEHRLVTGFEAGLSTTDTQIGIGAAAPIDIHTPVYGAHPAEPALRPTKYDVLRIGAYALDQIRLTPSLIVVPSMRWSRLGVEDQVAASAPDLSTSSVSPGVGVVVVPRPWLSLYGTFARGFEPPAPGQYLEDGRALAPAESDSFEAGVKADVAGGRLSATAAGFGIRQTNVAEADPLGFYRQIGEGESRGVELELVGSLVRGLAVRSGYAFTKTEITRDAGGFAGRDLPNAPRHTAHFWLRYRFPQRRPGTISVGAGVVYVSDRFSGRDNLVVVPEYARVDATASWELAGPPLTMGLAAQNLTNLRYVTSGMGTTFIAGPARRIALQLTSRF